MNWDDLRIFLSVARAGSLSAAAKDLRVTQPTVGRRLKGLEEELGARLFERLPDGFVPTAAGQELLPLAIAMETTALTVGRKQPALAESAKGTVRISVWETLGQLLTSFLVDLRQTLPEIEIEISVSHINANLSRREADLVIQECLPENPGLIVKRMGAYTYAVYGSRDFVSKNSASLSERRYSECQWVGFDEEHTYFHNQTWLIEQLGDLVPIVRVNNGLIVHEAVRAGVGLGVLPCFAGDGDAELVRLTAPIPELVRNLHLVVHRDLRRSPAVRAVMDALTDIFKKDAERLLGNDGDAIRAAIAKGPIAANRVA